MDEGNLLEILAESVVKGKEGEGVEVGTVKEGVPRKKDDVRVGLTVGDQGPKKRTKMTGLAAA